MGLISLCYPLAFIIIIIIIIIITDKEATDREEKAWAD